MNLTSNSTLGSFSLDILYNASNSHYNEIKEWLSAWYFEQAKPAAIVGPFPSRPDTTLA